MGEPNQKYSPRWLENVLEQQRQSFLSAFAQATAQDSVRHIFHFIVAITFVLFAIFFRSLLSAFEINYTPEHFPMIVQILDHGEMLAFTFAFGTLAPYISQSRLPRFHLAGFLVALITCYVYLPSVAVGATRQALTWNYLAAFGIFVVIFVLGRMTAKKYLFKGESYVGAYLTLYLGYIVNYKYWFNIAVIDFPRMIFPFNFLSLDAQARKRSPAVVEWAYIFSPTILFTPLPIEEKDRVFTQEWKERLRGLVDFVVGLIFLFIAFEVRQNWIEYPGPEFNLARLHYGFLYYVYYFFASYAWMALPFGILRWYGMKLPDFFDYPLLATSPTDRWRRWNTFYYNWFYKAVFFPLFKKTRSLALAVGVVFFLTLIFHSGRLANGPLFLDRMFYRHPLMWNLSVFFAGHALLVYLGFKFPRLWIVPERRLAWLGVALMALLMSVIHIYAV